MHAFPDAVWCLDVQTSLYPFMIAGSTLYNPYLNICFELLKSAPEVVEFVGWDRIMFLVPFCFWFVPNAPNT